MTDEDKWLKYDKIYGKERLQIINDFLNHMENLYLFPYKEQNVFYFADNLKPEFFKNEDFDEVLKLLRTRKNTNRICFNEIYDVFRSVKKSRVQKEDFERERKEDFKIMNSLVGMPPKIKEMINRIAKSAKLPESEEDGKET